MQVWYRNIIVLTCSVIAFLLTGCISSGEVITISLDPAAVTGGENVGGHLTISVKPANAQCQPPPSYLSCPIQLTAQPADAVQVVGGTFPGLVTPDQGIVFADQSRQANFMVQTNPVQQETIVTLSATFLLCPAGRIPNSIIECRPQAVAQEIELTVQPAPAATGYTCGDPFAYGEKRKPPLPLRDNFGLPPGFEELTLNTDYVIGFNFAEANGALMAQPVGAECRFADPMLGHILGVVWDVVGAEGESFVVSVPLNTQAEVVEGFLFRSLEEMIPVKFQVDQLKPVAPEEALPFDLSIRAFSVCFRVEDHRFCSLEESDGGQLLSARQRFGDAYARDVVDRIQQAQEILQEVGLHNPDAEVLVFEAISEIEQPERIEECQEDAEQCRADLIMAAVIPPQLVGGRPLIVPVSFVYQEEIEIAIFVLTEPLIIPPVEDGDTFELPPGNYVLYAHKGDDNLLELPVIARGVPDQPPGDIIEAVVPAVILPFVDEEGIGAVAIHEVSIYDYVCLFWERCSYLTPRR